ncbi:fumarylacetoacetate hydrolase family protein [Aquabacterium sp.]|uniref:fumarylacetoacetate hydrolase family protein n=1 Tax=Aquabacterium sp. TaxID=1872578 RepID=UPI003784DC8D
MTALQAVKAVKVQRDGACAAGLLADDGRVAIVGPWHAGPAQRTPFELAGVPAAAWPALAAAAPEQLWLQDIELAAPVDGRSKLICVGANYRDHAAEIGLSADTPPQVFLRHADSLVGHDQPLWRPRVSAQLDFEGELAVVIGRPARHVAPAQALARVLGYSCFLDGSVRDYQRQSIGAGKNFWRSGAMGPWIVAAEGLPAAADLALATHVNGQPVQQGRTGQMVHDVAALVAYCSQWTALLPGDVIATGTPAGIGARRNPPLWLRAGDVVEVTIEGLGTLRNPVLDEADG